MGEVVAMGPPPKVQMMRNRVAALEEELRERETLLKVKRRVDELELEVKCKDALLAARRKRDQDEDEAARQRVTQAEKPVEAQGANLADKLGSNWVSIEL